MPFQLNYWQRPATKINYESSGWSYTFIGGGPCWLSPDKQTFLRIDDPEEVQRIERKLKLKKINELKNE